MTGLPPEGSEEPDVAVPADRLTVDLLKQNLGPVTRDPPPAFADYRNRAESERIELGGRQQFYELRGRWSAWLLVWITSLLLFQVVLTVAIGLKLLDFTGYNWFLPMVVAQNFLQIVGMGIVIVNFLYPGGRVPRTR